MHDSKSKVEAIAHGKDRKLLVLVPELTELTEIWSSKSCLSRPIPQRTHMLLAVLYCLSLPVQLYIYI